MPKERHVNNSLEFAGVFHQSIIASHWFLFTCVAPHLVVENSNIVSISDILSGDLDFPDLYVDVEQQNDTAKEQESPVDVSYAVHEDLSEDILKVHQIIWWLMW